MSSSFMETGLDWSSDEMSAQEQELMLAWYRSTHEASESSELSKFAEFWISIDPGGFKRYRRHMIEIDKPRNGFALPGVAHVLMYLCFYTALGNTNGILYLVVAARALGAKREEVTDTFRLAALMGGPFGMNEAAELTHQYLLDWPEGGDEPGVPWPEGWIPNPDAVRSGIDHATNDLSDDDLRALRAWYLKVYGEVPSHVDVLAAKHPRALKTQRIRYEAAFGSTLPPQVGPLSQLLVAAQRQWNKPMVRAVQLAKHLGVADHHIVETLFWSGVYGDEMVMETAIDTVGHLLTDDN